MTTDVARHRLERIRTELDRLENVLRLPDVLARLTSFVREDDVRFFTTDYTNVTNVAKRWSVNVYIGPKWDNPRASYVGDDPWVIAYGPSLQVAAERAVTSLELTTPKEPQP